MNKSKEIDKYLFYRKLDKIIIFAISFFVLAGLFYWQWTNDQRIKSEYKIGTMIGFDNTLSATANGLEGEPVFLAELDDGRRVKIHIRPGALMLRGKKVEILETSNTQLGTSSFELIRYLDENN